MPGFVLSMRITDDTSIRGLSRRFSALAREATEATAQFWHDDVFPKHFGPRNRSEYNYEPRTRFYLEVTKKKRGVGVGKFRDEVLTGDTERWMRFLYKITWYARGARVRFQTPVYVCNPVRESFIDRYTGKLRKVSRQPDKPDELTRFSDADNQLVRDMSETKLLEKIEASRLPPQTTSIP